MNALTKKIKNDRFCKEIFRLDKDIYLVGGFIRDSVLGRKAVDRDFIVSKDPREIAERAAGIFGGTIVSFKDDMTIRLALDKGVTLDFTKIVKDINYDLSFRDITINSIAFGVDEGFIDPMSGFSDIESQVIRTDRKESLLKDPLRCLRAYRFMGELGWKISPDTRSMITEFRDRLSLVPVERITLEFFKMMCGKHFPDALDLCIKDGIIDYIITNNNNGLTTNFMKLLEVEAFFDKLPYSFRKVLDDIYSSHLTFRGLIRLERLLFGVAIGSINLALSNLIERRLIRSGKFLADLEKYGEDLDLFEVFFASPDMIYDLVCISASDVVMSGAGRFLKIRDKKIISTDEIMELSGMSGERLGRLLYQIDRERFYGTIRTKKHVIDMISST